MVQTLPQRNETHQQPWPDYVPPPSFMQLPSSFMQLPSMLGRDSSGGSEHSWDSMPSLGCAPILSRVDSLQLILDAGAYGAPSLDRVDSLQQILNSGKFGFLDPKAQGRAPVPLSVQLSTPKFSEEKMLEFTSFSNEKRPDEPRTYEWEPASPRSPAGSSDSDCDDYKKSFPPLSPRNALSSSLSPIFTDCKLSLPLESLGLADSLSRENTLSDNWTMAAFYPNDRPQVTPPMSKRHKTDMAAANSQPLYDFCGPVKKNKSRAKNIVQPVDKLELVDVNLSIRALFERPCEVVAAVDANSLSLGSYTMGQRRAKIQRYRAKKERMKDAPKKLTYRIRTEFAATRPRHKGRFMKKHPIPPPPGPHSLPWLSTF